MKGWIRFRKKPVIVEAIQFVPGMDESLLPAEILILHDRLRGRSTGPIASVITPNGPVSAEPGDWFVKGVEGEYYPISAAILRKTYDILAGSKR